MDSYQESIWSNIRADHTKPTIPPHTILQYTAPYNSVACVSWYVSLFVIWHGWKTAIFLHRKFIMEFVWKSMNFACSSGCFPPCKFLPFLKLKVFWLFALFQVCYIVVHGIRPHSFGGPHRGATLLLTEDTEYIHYIQRATISGWISFWWPYSP